MSVSTCRCRREPRRLFSFRLNIWILCVSKKKWVLVLSVPWYFVYYWPTQCAGLCGCVESSVMPDGHCRVGRCRSVFIFHTFLYFEEKKSKKNCSIGGKQCDQGKDEFNSSLMGLGAHSGFQLSRAAPPSPAQWFSLQTLGSKKLVSWVSRCLPCFLVTYILFLALKERQDCWTSIGTL